MCRNKVHASVISRRYLEIIETAIYKKPKLLPFVIDITVALKSEDALWGVAEYLTRKQKNGYDIIDDIVEFAYEHGAPEEVSKEEIKEILLSMKRNRLANALAQFMEVNDEVAHLMWARVNNAIDYAYGKFSD